MVIILHEQKMWVQIKQLVSTFIMILTFLYIYYKDNIKVFQKFHGLTFDYQ